jgi:hypothetical protein
VPLACTNSGLECQANSYTRLPSSCGVTRSSSWTNRSVLRLSGCNEASQRCEHVRTSVVLLRRAGMRLRRAELAPPQIGDLRVGDAGATSFKRPGLVAYLWEQRGALDRHIGLPLFDVALVHVGPDSFSLAGLELQALDGRVREFAQVWRCAMISS